MATNTTNFNLKKPAYTDTADIADINGNMDKVDGSLNGLADAIAIVANNNTHAAITAGQYVYVHGHGTLAEGLYTAKSNISANATLSISNLQADGSGGLNALNSNLNNRTKVKEQSTDANSITDTCIIRTTSGSTNLPDSTNVEGILVSYISYLQGAYVGVQYFSEYATNKVYSRLIWYGSWRSWVQLSN